MTPPHPLKEAYCHGMSHLLGQKFTLKLSQVFLQENACLSYFDHSVQTKKLGNILVVVPHQLRAKISCSICATCPFCTALHVTRVMTQTHLLITFVH